MKNKKIVTLILIALMGASVPHGSVAGDSRKSAGSELSSALYLSDYALELIAMIESYTEPNAFIDFLTELENIIDGALVSDGDGEGEGGVAGGPGKQGPKKNGPGKASPHKHKHIENVRKGLKQKEAERLQKLRDAVNKGKGKVKGDPSQQPNVQKELRDLIEKLYKNIPAHQQELLEKILYMLRGFKSH